MKSSFWSRKPRKADTPPGPWAKPFSPRVRQLDNLRANVQEAVECHFDPNNRPKIIRLHMVREEVISI